MNKKLLTLTLGELQRLNKYGVTTISFVVALMWFLLLFFIDDLDILSMLLPFVVLIDATMMSIIYIGSVMFFEKSESTISTMMVTPVKKSDLIWSKVIANTISQTLSTFLVILVFMLVKDVEVVVPLAILVLIVSIIFHSLLGFVFSYHAKDFTTMLVNMMIYVFVLSIPVFLYQFEILLKGEIFEYILMITPTQWAVHLIEAAFGGTIGVAFYVSLILMILTTIVGYRFYVLPEFKRYAVRESGV